MATLDQAVDEAVQTWRFAPVVDALRALRGVNTIIAATVVAEIGDMTRFENPRQLMAWLGLVPSEHSSGSTTRRGPPDEDRECSGPERCWWKRAGPIATRPRKGSRISSDPRTCRRRSRISAGRRRPVFASGSATSRTPANPSPVCLPPSRESSRALYGTSPARRH